MEDDRWDRYRRAQNTDWEPEPAPPPPWFEYVERLLLHLTIVGLVALVLVQMLLTQPPLRRLMVVADRLEGVDWEVLLSRPEVVGRTRYPAAPRPEAPDAGTLPPDPGRHAADGAATGTGGGTGNNVPGPAGASSGDRGPARASSGASSPPSGQSNPTGQSNPSGQSNASSGDQEDSARTDSSEPALGRVPDGQLTVMLISQPSAPGVYLLVDGRRAGDFGKGSVTARVRAGQRVEVDGRAIDSALTFRVTAVEGLAEPRLGEQTTTDGDLAVLGVAG